MTQRHFHSELDHLKSRLVHMAGLAEERVQRAVQSLKERDAEAARQVIVGDRDLNALEMEIDERALNLLALQQPMARDLRFIAMATKISNDLERVGDHAVNIAETVRKLVDFPPLLRLPELDEMARIATGMLGDALDSFINADSKLAREIGERDDRVDDLHRIVFDAVVERMESDPGNVKPGIGHFLVSRNIERIADLATNLAEDVVYMVEGRTIKHPVEEMKD